MVFTNKFRQFTWGHNLIAMGKCQISFQNLSLCLHKKSKNSSQKVVQLWRSATPRGRTLNVPLKINKWHHCTCAWQWACPGDRALVRILWKIYVTSLHILLVVSNSRWQSSGTQPLKDICGVTAHALGNQNDQGADLWYASFDKSCEKNCKVER